MRLARSHGRLQDVVLLAQVLDGPEEALRVLHEGDEHAERGGAGEHAQASEPDDAGDRRRREHFDHGIVNGVREDGVLERVHVGAVDLLELLV